MLQKIDGIKASSAPAAKMLSARGALSLAMADNARFCDLISNLLIVICDMCKNRGTTSPMLTAAHQLHQRQDGASICYGRSALKAPLLCRSGLHLLEVIIPRYGRGALVEKRF